MKVLLIDPAGDMLPALQPSLLSVDGLELYCAPDGATAVEHASLLGGVDVLVTEVFLPGMDGFSVRDAILKAAPGLHTVFLTRHDLGAYAEGLGSAPLLQLPVAPEAILQAVQLPPPKKKPPAREAVQPPLFFIPKAKPPADATLEPPSGAPATPSLPSSNEEFLHNGSTNESAPPPPPLHPNEEKLPEEESVHDSSPPDLTSSPLPLYAGCSLGPYHILRDDGPHPMGQCFAAVHSTLNRSVYLIVFDPAKAGVPGGKALFLADAAAKARVQHPRVLSVYEAGESDGRTFYALERIEAETLETRQKRRPALDGSSLYQIACAAAEVFAYFETLTVARTPLKPSDILLPLDGGPRFQNPGIGGLHPTVDTTAELKDFGALVLNLLRDKTPSLLRTACEGCVGEGMQRVSSWSAFQESLNPASKTAAERDPSFAVGLKRDQMRRDRLKKHSRLSWLMGALLTVAVGMACLNLLKPEPRVPRQAVIPEGQYIVASGKRVKLDSFSIDSTEISVRQYFRFLEWLRSHPNEATQYDHPEQTPRHSHTPPGWAEGFPGKLRPERTAQDPRWNLPVTQVAWWDAYSFAAWAGRALPTDEQWEAAGRGPRGFLFPWGDEPEPERANVSRPDFQQSSGEKPGTKPVDSLMDGSPYKVFGLAGNVSEWTATEREGKYLAKGSHYNSPLVSLDASTAVKPDTRSPHLGFRTVNAASQNRP